MSRNQFENNHAESVLEGEAVVAILNELPSDKKYTFVALSDGRVAVTIVDAA